MTRDDRIAKLKELKRRTAPLTATIPASRRTWNDYQSYLCNNAIAIIDELQAENETLAARIALRGKAMTLDERIAKTCDKTVTARRAEAAELDVEYEKKK